MIKLIFPFRLISKDNEKVFNRYGRPFLSKKFKSFENQVKLVAKSQYKGDLLIGDLSLVLVANYKNKVHPDAQNLFKSSCDALQEIIYKNDKQIKHAEVVVLENSDSDNFIIIRILKDLNL